MWRWFLLVVPGAVRFRKWHVPRVRDMPVAEETVEIAVFACQPVTNSVRRPVNGHDTGCAGALEAGSVTLVCRSGGLLAGRDQSWDRLQGCTIGALSVMASV